MLAAMLGAGAHQQHREMSSGNTMVRDFMADALRTCFTDTDQNSLFARPLVLSAARVRENCFLVSPSMSRCWQSSAEMSTTTFCAFSTGLSGSGRALPRVQSPKWGMEGARAGSLSGGVSRNARHGADPPSAENQNRVAARFGRLVLFQERLKTNTGPGANQDG